MNSGNPTSNDEDIRIPWKTELFCLILLALLTMQFSCKENLTLQVKVLDRSSSNEISQADVSLLIGNSAPYSDVTDTSGLARIGFPSNALGTSAQLTIRKNGCETTIISVTLAKESTQTVQLNCSSQLPGLLGETAPIPGIVEATPTPPPDESDLSLPTFTCLLSSFGSYFPLIQIKQQKLDIQNGFDLVIIPWYLPTDDNRYDYDVGEVAGRLASGEWDCMLTTLDDFALEGNFGIITAFVDESAGADQVWVREGIETVNDFVGKRIVFPEETVSEFLVYGLLDIVGLTTQYVDLQPAATMEDAVAIFNRGDADIIVGWEPDILGATEGGHILLDTSQIRYVIDVIAVSQHAIDTKHDIVQSFHRAWFQALKLQAEDLPIAAQSIADWGNNEWTYVNLSTAAEDLKNLLEGIAQASYLQNWLAMQSSNEIFERIEHARTIWSLSGRTLPPLDINSSVDASFVLALNGDPSIQTSASLPNSDFSLPGTPPYPDLEGGQSVATFSCTQFEFIPNTTDLTLESQLCLDEEVVPVLKASKFYVLITGSAAWPGTPTYTEEQIKGFAQMRADRIAQYLAGQGIDPTRFSTNSVIPPVERRRSPDDNELAKDRWVRIELILGW